MCSTEILQLLGLDIKINAQTGLSMGSLEEVQSPFAFFSTADKKDENVV